MEIQQRYSLKDFQDIIFNGFQFELPDSALKLINEISNEVGSPTYVKTPIFQKRESAVPVINPLKLNVSKEDLAKIMTGRTEQSSFNKKKRGKNVEVVNDEDWETIRTFHTTKMEEKTGVEVQYDIIRSYLNKLTDKNIEEMIVKIIQIIEEIKNKTQTQNQNQTQNENENNAEINSVLNVIFNQIFENAFNNRFYSHIYVLLYSKLLDKYNTSFANYQEKQTIELLNKIQLSIQSIEYVEPSVNYDKFCKINKENEKRKAMCEFLMNLMKQQMIKINIGFQLLNKLLDSLIDFIKIENKKNEVDELSELIFILWKKNFYDSLDGSDEFFKKIELLSQSKTKDYLSLTNKTIFKFMDMIDM
jgi:ribosomal protein L12E/L44/L45/RPP1/RPP2